MFVDQFLMVKMYEYFGRLVDPKPFAQRLKPQSWHSK